MWPLARHVPVAVAPGGGAEWNDCFWNYLCSRLVVAQTASKCTKNPGDEANVVSKPLSRFALYVEQRLKPRHPARSGCRRLSKRRQKREERWAQRENGRQAPPDASSNEHKRNPN